MAMVRKQVYLEAAQDREIKAEAKRRGVSEAEVIRERLDASPDATSSNIGLRISPASARRRRPRTPGEERILMETLSAFDDLDRRTKRGSGRGVKFNREELYAERLDKIAPR